jgi:hypothetical protein
MIYGKYFVLHKKTLKKVKKVLAVYAPCMYYYHIERQRRNAKPEDKAGSGSPHGRKGFCRVLNISYITVGIAKAIGGLIKGITKGLLIPSYLLRNFI